MTCPSEGKFEQGSLCNFRCKGDQELVGSSQTMCSDGKWDQVDKNPPKCRDRTCSDLTGSVKYGKIQCQSLTLADRISIGGSCTLNCGEGEIIISKTKPLYIIKNLRFQARRRKIFTVS